MKTGMSIQITENTDEVMAVKNAALERAAEMIGLQAEEYAKMKCPVGTPEGT